MYTQQEGKDIYIGEIFEFIQQILDLKKYKKHIFYRGHSSERYHLIPSLFRKNSQGRSIYSSQEHILYRELYMSEYKEFINDRYTLVTFFPQFTVKVPDFNIYKLQLYAINIKIWF